MSAVTKIRSEYGTCAVKHPNTRSGRRDLDWGVQILVFEVDRGVLRQFEIQVVFFREIFEFF